MAARNIEIKARCRDLQAARDRAERLATSHVGVDRQVDTYFRTAAGRLKLRRSSLDGGHLVPYVRPDRAAVRRSDYERIPVDDADAVERLLGEILGVHCVVRKEREIFLHDNVRIHLDRVEGLGTFVELEAVFDGSDEAAEERKVKRLMDALGVSAADLVGESYENLIRRPRRS